MYSATEGVISLARQSESEAKRLQIIIIARSHLDNVHVHGTLMVYI